MKKVLVSLALLMSLSLSAQSLINVNHDSRLTKHLFDFENHSRDINFDKSNINCLLNIRIVSDYYLEKSWGNAAWGLTKRFYDNGMYVVYINEEVFKYKDEFVNAVLYHELYHVFATQKDHCNGLLCPEIINGKALKVEYIEKTWDEDSKKDLINYIRWNQLVN